MNEIEAIKTVGRETFKAKFSWVRYITGLSSGAFTVIITFHSNFESAPVESLYLCLCLLFLTLFLGTHLLYLESEVSQRLLTRLAEANAQSEIHSDLIHAVAIPVLGKKEKIVFPTFCISFLASMASLLIYALTGIGG